MPRRKRSSRAPRKAASRRPATRASGKPDALRMLKEDHQRVQALFARFERTRGEAAKQRLAETICQELTLHARLEEEIFYPATRKAIRDDDLMNEAEVEHASAKDLIVQIEASSASDPRYDALVTVLGEYVKHHVKEEETEMFKKVREAGLDLRALGEAMQERKRALGGAEGQAKGTLASFFSRSR